MAQSYLAFKEVFLLCIYMHAYYADGYIISAISFFQQNKKETNSFLSMFDLFIAISF